MNTFQGTPYGLSHYCTEGRCTHLKRCQILAGRYNITADLKLVQTPEDDDMQVIYILSLNLEMWGVGGRGEYDYASWIK